MNETIFQTVMLAANKNELGEGQRWLVQIHPLDLEQNRVELGPETLTIGRADTNNLVLDDDSVSRLHACIGMTNEGYAITDMGSTNGVVVNDELVQSQILKTGDRIQLGSRIFRFLADTDVESQYHETVYGMMTRDGLTSVFNKRYLLECLDREVARCQRHSRPLAVIMLDIDHFKSFNDTYGHLIGDEILRELAARLTALVGEDAIFARFGGEEFAIVHAESNLAHAAELAEEYRQAIAASPFATSDGPLEVSASFGVAACEAESHGRSAQALLIAADQKLYEAKNSGRNRVCW